MKKILSFVLSIVLVLTMLIPTAFAQDTGDAPYDWYTSGTYEIDEPSELYEMLNLLNGADGQTATDFAGITVKLSGNLDMTGFTWDTSSTVKSFLGTFDGQNHTLSNLSMTGYGLFKFSGGTIKNFTLENASLEAAGGYTGSIVGKRSAQLSIMNVRSDCKISAADKSYVGGILGNTQTSGSSCTISNCTFSGSIEATGHVGGIVGYATQTDLLKIENCTNFADITVTGQFAGGIVGSTKVATDITNCSNFGTVASTSTVFGGLVGCTATSTEIEISDSANNGMLIANAAGGATHYFGGVVGQLGGTVAVRNCSNTGDMTIATSGKGGGGIVGYLLGSVTIDACVVSCDMITGTTADARFGGLIGLTNTSGSFTVSDCLVSGSMKPSNSVEPTQTGGITGRVNGSPKGEVNNVIVALSGKMTSAFGNSMQNSISSTCYVKYTNVYYDSTLLGAEVADFSCTSTNTTYFSAFGGKTTEELMSSETVSTTLGGKWIAREGNYPLPANVADGNTYMWGYQTRTNTDDSVDYRFVANLNCSETLPESVGFYAVLTSGDNKIEQTVYCNTVYTAVKGGGNIYRATEQGGDWLFVLVLGNVPADAEFSAVITPFTVDADGTLNYGITCRK